MGEKRVLAVGRIRPGRGSIPVRRLSEEAEVRGEIRCARATIPSDILRDLATREVLEAMAQRLDVRAATGSAGGGAGGATTGSAGPAGQ